MNDRITATLSLMMLSAMSCYHAPDKPQVSFISPKPHEEKDKEEQEPEEKIEEPAMCVISVDVSDILAVRLDGAAEVVPWNA
jgi:hypothetical protein